MRIRFRGPSGGASLELAEDAIVADLLTALKAESGSGAITVKYGWPLQTLAADQGHLPVRALGLQRENLTIVPVDGTGEQPPAASAIAPAPAISTSRGADKVVVSGVSAMDEQSAENLTYGSGEDVKVEMPESRTSLVLRVMPDDGDCMFTAVGGALGGLLPSGASSGATDYTPSILRHIVVDAITSNPSRFNTNFLGSSPSDYCGRLLGGMWGGGIELSILSELFRVEIYSVDVKTGKVYQFGEQQGYDQFCVVIYSGVHYDRIAEAAMEEVMNMVEFDMTRWNTTGNERIIRHAQEICKILRDRHYYTSVSDFVVVCNECQVVLQGEKAISHHVRLTGHSGVTEIADTT